MQIERGIENEGLCWTKRPKGFSSSLLATIRVVLLVCSQFPPELLQGISPRLTAPDYELAVLRNQSNRPQAQKTSCPKSSSLPFSNLPCLLGDKTLLSGGVLPTLRKRKPKESGQASVGVPPAQSVSITSCLFHHTSTLDPCFRHIPAAKPTRTPEKD